MFQSPAAEGYLPVLDKIRRKTLVHGEQTLLAEFRLDAGAVLPRHSHPHEQTGYLVSGVLELTIGERTERLTAGGSWCIPGHVEHHAVAHADCVAIEVFAPRRDDYLP